MTVEEAMKAIGKILYENNLEMVVSHDIRLVEKPKKEKAPEKK